MRGAGGAGKPRGRPLGPAGRLKLPSRKSVFTERESALPACARLTKCGFRRGLGGEPQATLLARVPFGLFPLEIRESWDCG